MGEKISFIELAGKRSSIRKYLNKNVGKDLIIKAVQAASLAPSACNSQPWHFIVVDDSDSVRKLSRATFLPLSKMNRFVSEAPIIVAVVSEQPNLSSGIGGYIKKKPYYLMDIGMAVEHFCLQAAEDNLGTCILGWFNEKKVKKFLGVPRKRGIPLLITLGYPDPEYRTVKHRKMFDSIISFNRYGI